MSIGSIWELEMLFCQQYGDSFILRWEKPLSSSKPQQFKAQKYFWSTCAKASGNQQWEEQQEEKNQVPKTQSLANHRRPLECGINTSMDRM